MSKRRYELQPLGMHLMSTIGGHLTSTSPTTAGKTKQAPPAFYLASPLEVSPKSLEVVLNRRSTEREYAYFHATHRGNR